MSSSWKKRVLQGLGVVVGLALVSGAAGWLFLRSSIPTADGTQAIRGLEHPVEITRDAHGNPSVWATTDADALRALGYLHARDRLWQMEFSRRVADGRLAEILGADLVSSDQFLRTLGLGHAAIADEKQLDEVTRALVVAYVEGVNAYLSTRKEPLPPEFALLRFEPEPWSVRNTLSIAKIVSWDLALWDHELEYQRAADTVPADKFAALQPVTPGFDPSILTQEATGAVQRPAGGRLVEAAPRIEIPEGARAALERSSLVKASNSWVIGGSRTRSGKPIVANDTHLSLQAPSLFYLVGLRGDRLVRAGVTIPGMPGIILGTAPTFSWAFTNGMVDDVDFYVESVDPKDDTRYLTPDGSRPFELRRETIAVKGADPVEWVVRSTRHGPVFSDAIKKRARGRVLAMRWSAIEPTTGMRALLAMNRAASWREFLDATRDFDTSHLNLVFGATDGTIGYALVGKVPVRRNGDGLLPVPGHTDDFEWDRILSGEELPRAINPPEDFIVTANNEISRAYPHLITRLYADPYRAMRIRELISSGARFTAADVAAQQLDVEDVLARRVRPLAVAAARKAGRSDLAELLERWDAKATPDSQAASLFYLWFEALRRKVGADEYKLNDPAAKMYFPRSALVRALEAGGGLWVDDVTTPAVETLDELAAGALVEAADRAQGKPWSAFHSTRADHALGKVAVLDWLLSLNLGPWTKGGSSHTVNVAVYGADGPPFVARSGASQRQVIDLGALDEGGYVIPTGASGHPMSPWYRDQQHLWLAGQLLPLRLEREHAQVAHTFTLTPDQPTTAH